jgi:hypothetical protein
MSKHLEPMNLNSGMFIVEEAEKVLPVSHTPGNTIN